MKKNVNSATGKNAGKSSGKQSGGTILGIIIGLVIGLTIAVVVALMITKTSTPFTNKLGITKGPDTPAMQLTDPNKPLYGSSAKEILANANKGSDAASPAEAAPSAPIQALPAIPPNQTVAVRASEPAKPDAPKVDSKNAKPAEQAGAKPDNDDKAPAYYLQVGAFRDVSDAEGARAKLALLGIESHVSNGGNAEGDSLYRVRIGPFDQLDTMNRMRSKLSENSIDVAVIKTPK